MSSPAHRGAAGLLLRAMALLVPRHRREDWLEEWRAELDALMWQRVKGAAGLPAPARFVAGALPHALWLRTEGWTMDSLVQDLKYAARVLRRAPGFTAVAALTLALGIGANASIFSLVNGLVLSAPAGVEDPDRLVQIARSYESAPRWDNFSYPAMQTIESESRVFDGVAGYSAEPFTIGEGLDTEQVMGQYVSGDYFMVLGVQPLAGRTLQPSDDVRPGEHRVVVLSHRLWTRRYGGDRSAIGTTLLMGAIPYEIVGVTPPDFAGVESIGTAPEVFVALMQHPGYRGDLLFDEWGASWIELVGRLRAGVSFQEARASMEVVSARLREAASVNEEIEVLLAEGIGLSPDGRSDARQLSQLLGIIVLVVLLLTCTNVANLFLARASGRTTEVGVRMALGAGRSRLARQLITESTLVALLATVLALPLVLLADDLLPALFPFNLTVSVGADGRVFGFLAFIGLAAGLLFGAAPAWATSRRDVAGTLRENASSGGRSSTRLRDGLVVAQISLSLGLVAAAGLLGRSVLNAQRADAGFQASGLKAAIVSLAGTGRYDEASGLEFYRSLIDEAESTVGVRSATLANQMPLVGGHSRASARPLGHEDGYEAEYVVVGPRYFETLGIPILEGRPLSGFTDGAEPVVVVNRALASMFWPGETAVGQEIEARGGRWRVVGVSGDVQMRSLRAPALPAVYYPLIHAYSGFMALHLATEPGTPVDMMTARRLIADVDPQLPVTGFTDLGSAASQSMGETRTIGYLVSTFAVLALALAIVGLYGLVSFSAAQRIREIGIRIALGAEPAALVRLILRRGLTIALLGVTVGLGVSFGLGSALQGLLFGVSRTDPLALAAAATLLLIAAAVAAWIPARRASRVDAAISLRD